jgi:hypothetical protein
LDVDSVGFVDPEFGSGYKWHSGKLATQFCRSATVYADPDLDLGLDPDPTPTPVMWIHIVFNAHPDPSFNLSGDPNHWSQPPAYPCKTFHGPPSEKKPDFYMPKFATFLGSIPASSDTVDLRSGR